MNRRKIAPGRSLYRVVLAHALASSCALAQSAAPATESPADEVELAPITVSAHDGYAVPYNRTGVSVTVLDVEELKEEGVYTLTEALTSVPGVYVMPGGGTYQRGNTSNLVIRGLSSQKYVMPLMDGMRLGGGLAGSNAIVVSEVVARYPVFGLGNPEVVRGAQGAVYGGGAMSGVLFMDTPEGKGLGMSVFSEYGSFDSYTGNLTAQGRENDTAFYFSSTYERTNNDIHFADGSRAVLKHAGKYENFSNALRFDHYYNERNQLTLTYRREDSTCNSYSPASDWGPASLSLYDFRTNLVTVRYRSQVNEKYSTGLMVGYYGNEKVIGAKGTGPSLWYYDLNNVQVEWRNVYQWNEQQKTTAGVAWSRSDYKTRNQGERLSFYSNLDSTLSFFAEHNMQPVKNWDNSLAFRLDRSNVYHTLMTLRASTNYMFNHERTRAYASVGRGYAAPSSFEKSRAVYSLYGANYHGNPALDCETNLSADLGVEHELVRDHFVSATLFWMRTEDAIVTVGNGPDYYFENANGHQTAQGIELAARGVFEKNWNTGYKIAYTLTQPKTSHDRQIASSARQVWSAELHTSPCSKLTTGIGLSAAVGRYGYNSKPLDNYLTLRWFANYELNENVSLHLRVENLTNCKYMLDHDWSGAAAATWINSGTAVYAGCTVKF